MEFKELQLHPDLQAGIEKAGFTELTNVQEETFTQTLAGRDVLVQSQTGTGKTAAFLISIFQLLLEDKDSKGRKALVVAPTRELADQIEKEAKILGAFLPFRIASFFGGVGYGPQEKAIRDGVDVIIGTPGRLLDFNQQGKLLFNEVRLLVIDEADRLFDMGFLPDLRRMLRRMPKREERITMLFSATLGLKVSQLAWDYMNEPVEIAIEPEHMTVEEITQELYHVARTEKFSLLLGLLKKENPESVLIFTNTKHAAVEISKRLELNGYVNQFIIGDLPQKKRLAVIESIKAGNLKALVATDVAARGLHIDDLSLVVNYDLPEDPENYVHRIGRTARAGKTGKAISLADETFVFGLESIEKLIGRKIPVVWAGDELYAEDASKGVRVMHRLRTSESGPRRGGTRSGLGRPRTGAPGARRTPRAPVSYDRELKPETVESGPGGTERGDADRSRRRGNQPQQGNTGAGRPPKDQPARRSVPPKGGTADKGRTASDTPLEDRVAYYREKYGENFTAPGKTAAAPKGAGGASSGQGAGKNKRRKNSNPSGGSAYAGAAPTGKAAEGKLSQDRRTSGGGNAPGSGVGSRHGKPVREKPAQTGKPREAARGAAAPATRAPEKAAPEKGSDQGFFKKIIGLFTGKNGKN